MQPHACYFNIADTWGDVTGTGDPTSGAYALFMGGTSPDIDNMILEEIHCYLGGSGTARFAVFQGGTLPSAAGADLIWDAGTVATPSEPAFVSLIL